MNGAHVSIVVPVYNVELYLEECIDSILNQTYSDLQIILIDDGSTDRSGEIIEQYKKADQRVITVHKDNGGSSSARNVGLKHAEGEYVVFIDSDDIIHRNFVRELLDAAYEDDADITACDFISIRDNKPDDNKNYKKIKMLMNSREAIFEMYKSDSIGWNIWNKLFKRSLFEDIQFPEGRLCEDKATIYKLLLEANRISYLHIPLYYYRLRSQSISNSRSVKLYMDSLITNAEMEKEFEFRGLETELLLAKSYSAKCAFILYSDVIKHDRYEEVEEYCIKELSEKYTYICYAKYLGRAERAAVYLSGISANTRTKIVLRLLCNMEQKMRRYRGLMN